MAFTRDPSELGGIFVGPGKGNYANTTWFSGKAFDIPDGTYRLDNVKGVSGPKSKNPGTPYHIVRVTRLDEQPEPTQDEQQQDNYQGELPPF